MILSTKCLLYFFETHSRFSMQFERCFVLHRNYLKGRRDPTFLIYFRLLSLPGQFLIGKVLPHGSLSPLSWAAALHSVDNFQIARSLCFGRRVAPEFFPALGVASGMGVERGEPDGGILRP